VNVVLLAPETHNPSWQWLFLTTRLDSRHTGRHDGAVTTGSVSRACSERGGLATERLWVELLVQPDPII